MDRIYRETLLFDFYGELLTEHQRNIYEEVVFEDCSLGEVAERHKVSRQSVHRSWGWWRNSFILKSGSIRSRR